MAKVKSKRSQKRIRVTPRVLGDRKLARTAEHILIESAKILDVDPTYIQLKNKALSEYVIYGEAMPETWRRLEERIKFLLIK